MVWKMRGMSKAAQQKLRTQVMKSVGVATTSRQCPTTALALQGPAWADPCVDIPAQVIGYWAMRLFEERLPDNWNIWWGPILTT